MFGKKKLTPTSISPNNIRIRRVHYTHDDKVIKTKDFMEYKFNNDGDYWRDIKVVDEIHKIVDKEDLKYYV